MAEVPLALVRSYERLREITSVLRALRCLAEAGFLGIFRMVVSMLAQVRSYVRL